MYTHHDMNLVNSNILMYTRYDMNLVNFNILIYSHHDVDLVNSEIFMYAHQFKQTFLTFSPSFIFENYSFSPTGMPVVHVVYT